MIMQRVWLLSELGRGRLRQKAKMVSTLRQPSLAGSCDGLNVMILLPQKMIEVWPFQERHFSDSLHRPGIGKRKA